MKKTTILTAVFLVALLSGSASAMVAHWTDPFAMEVSAARRITFEGSASVALNGTYATGSAPVGTFERWESQYPSLASGCSRSGGEYWGWVTDLSYEHDVNDGGAGHDYRDTAIPEPSTMVLLGVGLIGTSLVARRRRTV